MKEKLSEALGYIRDGHIDEAAGYKKKPRLSWLGGIAAAAAILILVVAVANPFAIRAQAVSTAKYPRYEWKYRDALADAVPELYGFFGASMTQSLSGAGSENMAYSPANLYMAMALTAELASGNSRQQILDALGAADQEALREQARQFWFACYRDDGDQTLLANSLWLSDIYTYDQAVMDTLAENYYTSVYKGDLGSPKINAAITQWLNSQTKGFLKDATAQVSLPIDTVLALYSTIYYRALWTDSSKFRAANNTAGKFHAPGGDITVTYMNKKEMHSEYYWAEDYGAISLGLKDGSRMWLILPDEDKTVDQVLSSGEYSRMLQAGYSWKNSKYMKVNLSLPQFDIKANSDLREDMEALGITDVFYLETADFSQSVKDSPVVLTGVNQATRVAIDEEGVTAASYIEIPGAGAAMPPDEIIDFVLNRPFLFVITNRYDIPLFAGVVNEP